MPNRFALEPTLRVGGVALSAALTVAAVLQSNGHPAPPLGLACVLYALVAALAIGCRAPLPEALPPTPALSTQLVASTLCAAMTLYLYRDVLHAWYLADDLFFVVHFADASWATLGVWLWPDAASPVQIIRPLSHAVTAGLLDAFGSDPLPAHAVNVALHATTAILTCRLASRLTGRFGVGLGAGLTVAVQPLAVPTVSWIATHQDPLAVMFSSLSLVLLLEAVAGRRYARAASLAAFILALMSKESATILPLPAIVLVFVADPRARRWRGLTRAVGPHVAACVAYVAYRVLVFGGLGGYQSGDRAAVLSANPELMKTALLQLPEVLLVPANRAIVDGAGTLRTCAAGLAVLTLAALLGRRRDPRSLALVAVGATIVVASILPVHNMIWMGPHLLNARYLYLASVGSSMVVGGLLFAVATDAPGRRRASTIAVAATMVVLLGHLSLAVANRDQWLSNASISGGLATDLRTLDVNHRIERLTLVDFPDFWRGSYIFNLQLLPIVALGQEIEVSLAVDDARHDVEPRRPFAPTDDALCVRYRFVGGERLWRRDRDFSCAPRND